MPEAAEPGARCRSCAAPVIEGNRFCPMCGTALTVVDSADRESRRIVVILFIDLVGSTALAESLDPEPLRVVMDRYYAVCAGAIAEHGGVVEKFIGDAVMAAFGVPTAHEDDALRAVRAAEAARLGVRDLGAEVARTHGIELDVHTGISSGEVVVTAASNGDLRVVGDAVNTAARLQSAAVAGETLLGAEVAFMVRAHTRLEQLPPLPLKGKADPVPVWRLLAIEAAPLSRGADAVPMIGRDDELGQLRHGFARAVRGSQCRLATVLGEPGLGKSRLVREFLAAVGDEATVMVGHCRSYGHGVTYRPIAEMIQSLPGGWDQVVAVLEPEPEGARALRSLATVAGDAAGPAVVVGVEEISWATRYLFEVLGNGRPIIAVWENLQWAEPTLLDLIDDLVSWLPGVPALMVCVARPELLETRPTWGGGKAGVSVLELERLTPAQTGELVGALVLAGDGVGAVGAWGPAPEVLAQSVDTAEVCRAVVDGCEGNPLFAELMLDVISENGPDALVSPTIQAVLSARLDGLPAVERRLLEWAATIGWEFTRGELGVLASVDGKTPDLDELLLRVVRRRLVQRGRGPGGFRFTQVLVRDTAYARTAKAQRERWHSGLVAWLQDGTAAIGATAADGRADGRADSRVDGRTDSRLGYHAEMACLLRREVSPGDPTLPELAARASRLLVDEGTVALRRKDLPAAAALLERGRDLLPVAAAEHPLLALRLADCRLGLGEPQQAMAALEVGERAAAMADRRVFALQRQLLSLRFGAVSAEQVSAEAEDLAATLADQGADDLSWYVLHQLQAFCHLGDARLGAAEEALRAALVRARSLGDEYAENRILTGLCELTQWSPTPVVEGLSLCAELLERFAADRSLMLPVLATKGRLLALAGDLDGARAVLATARNHADELHLNLGAVTVSQVQGLVESLAGSHRLAQEHFRRSGEELRAAGHLGPAKTLVAYQARETFRSGRTARAADLLTTLSAGPGGLDMRTEMITTALRAGLAAADGRSDDVLAQARLVWDMSERTDDLCLRGDTLAELAEALRAVGREDEAVEAVRSAARCYTAKGALLPAGRALAWLAAAPGTARDQS
ncbi:AAA family ATPase [Streptacidiphilus sp. EB129]|uniref:AAA family ATPase n=1 Tax=Streptacidiphilus sp. EB129 TaxID=3156262 RepID=UPI003511DEE1